MKIYFIDQNRTNIEIAFNRPYLRDAILFCELKAFGTSQEPLSIRMSASHDGRFHIDLKDLDLISNGAIIWLLVKELRDSNRKRILLNKKILLSNIPFKNNEQNCKESRLKFLNSTLITTEDSIQISNDLKIKLFEIKKNIENIIKFNVSKVCNTDTKFIEVQV